MTLLLEIIARSQKSYRLILTLVFVIEHREVSLEIVGYDAT